MKVQFEVSQEESTPEVDLFMKKEWKSSNLENFGRDISDSEWKSPLTIRAYLKSGYASNLELVGVARCNIMGRTLRLSQLLVKTKYRKQKHIGTQILSKIEELCKEDKIHKIRLSTSEKHHNIDFYRKNGFSVEATLHNDAFGLEWYILSKFVY